jgi:hypothetical protein
VSPRPSAAERLRVPEALQGRGLVRRIVVLTRSWHTPRVCFVFEKLGAQRALFAA